MAADPSQTTSIAVAAFGLGGVAIGALISGGIMFWSQTLTRRSDERRQRRELAINTAIANWQGEIEVARSSGVAFAMAPLDHYIIHMVRLSDLIERKNLTEKDIAVELAKIKKASRDAFDAAKEQEKKDGHNPFHNSSYTK